MLLRKAQSSDIKDITVLMENLNGFRESIISIDNWWFHEKTDKEGTINQKSINDYIIFIALSEGRIIWYIQWSKHIRRNQVYSELWYIDELFVDPEYRRWWVAKSLLEHLEAEFREQWCDHIVTHTDSENILSQNFYENNGLKPVTIELWKAI